MQLLSIRNIIVVLALCTMQICLSQAACDCKTACDNDDTINTDTASLQYCYDFCDRNTDQPILSCWCAATFTKSGGNRYHPVPQPAG
ncbi:unnamed protein product, partial [Adineta steineri]